MKKEKEKYHKTFIDKLINTIILLGSLFVVVLIVFIFVNVKVKASGEETVYDNTFPFYFDSIDNFNDYLYDDIYDAIENANLPIYDEDYVLMVTDYGFVGRTEGMYYWYNIYFNLVPIEEFSNVGNDFNWYTTALNYTRITEKPMYSFYVQMEYYHAFSPTVYGVNNNISNFTMFGHTPSFSQNDNHYICPRVPAWFNKNFKDENGKNILYYAPEGTPILTGHATPPEEFQHPVYTQGHAKPQTVPPTYTVNNYSWTTYTPPIVDNSTLEKLLESLTDIVKYNASYLKDNLHNEFSNLIDNIKGLIDFIGQTIQYYGDLIIETLQNLITTFYNNMLSLFEPISTAIDYISQPLQVEEVVTAIESTNIHTDVTSVVNLSNTAFGIFGTVSEPSSFTIPLDLTGIAILHQTQPFYIDLSWINSAKTYIRAFMWCIVTFGLLYSIVIGIPTMLKDSK